MRTAHCERTIIPEICFYADKNISFLVISISPGRFAYQIEFTVTPNHARSVYFTICFVPTRETKLFPVCFEFSIAGIISCSAMETNPLGEVFVGTLSFPLDVSAQCSNSSGPSLTERLLTFAQARIPSAKGAFSFEKLGYWQFTESSSD